MSGSNINHFTDNGRVFAERVLYEDNHLIVVNKLPSEIVQGDRTGDTPLADVVKTYIKDKYAKPGNVFLGVTHRIDRPVSGAVIFARTSKALSRLNALLRAHDICKKYWAVVHKKPEPNHGNLVHYLKKNEQKNKSFVVNSTTPGAKRAELRYALLASAANYHLLEVILLTGRHHQIRAQLAAMGCPIKGDLKYGFARSNKDASIHLHARSVEFAHPVSKENLKVQAAVPANDALWSFFEKELS